eukprot:s6666_g1.t1
MLRKHLPSPPIPASCGIQSERALAAMPAAAGGLAAAVSNFSKALSQGELDVAGNVSSALAAVGSALENQKDPLAGRPANSEEMARNAQYAMNNFTSMVRRSAMCRGAVGKIFKPKPQAPNPFQDVFKNPFEKAKPASNPLEAIGSMCPASSRNPLCRAWS